MAKEQDVAEAVVDTAAETSEDKPVTYSRDQIRGAILSAPSEDEVIEVFGVKVEIRAPALEDLLQYRNAGEDDFIMARGIVNNVYVPGTGERVFDDADIQGLMKSRFSKDMRKLSKVVTRVLGGDEEINNAVDNGTKRDKE
jgi:hypothetical protein